MDRSRDTVSSMLNTLKPARRRLQKSDPKIRSLAPKRVSHDSTASSVDSCPRVPPRQRGSVGRPSVSAPPDLSDSKWLDFVERNDLKSPVLSPCDPSPPVRRDSPPPPPPPRLRPAPLFPEFSHLAVADKPLSSTPPPNNASATCQEPTRHPAMSIMRRRAKTPVLTVGQLEKSALKRRQAEAVAAANRAAAEEAAAVEKPCSVELIAEQYRALLEFRDAEHGESDITVIPSNANSSPLAHTEPSLGHRNDAQRDLMAPRASVQLELPPLTDSSSLSPTSDAGTLVAFEEDAIYFKPVSLSSPEPSPSGLGQSFDRRSRNSSSSTNSHGPREIMELLTRELSPTSATKDVSSRQIWIMIEAYDKLRTQVSGMGLGEAERDNIHDVFDSWLGALHKVHESLADGVADSQSAHAL